MSQVDSTVSYLPIKDFPAYLVSSDGIGWSLWTCRGPFARIGSTRRIIKQTKDRAGRLYVDLFPGGKRYYIHRLVLETFVGPCPDGMVCRHFPDRDPTNNNLSNIQWGTEKENQADRNFHGTDNRGSNHGLAKLTDDDIVAIRKEYATGVYQRVIAEKYGVTQTLIGGIVRRKRWKHIV